MLQLHHASRTDLLADRLAELLAEPLADPFAEEVVVVPAKGVERWLTQRLSHRLGTGPRGGDGVCAGVRFLNPRSLVALLTGTERDDPWDPDRLVWPLLDVVDAVLGEPWCGTLADHLGHGATGELGELRRDRRYSVVRRVAGLFSAYSTQRPDLLSDWAAGRDTDGAGGALPGDLAWQAELWRRLVPRIAAPPPDERHHRTLEAIRAGAPLALPDRLSMFGHTRLPVTELELLRAVGEVREVHLWLPQPSPVLWERLASARAAGPVRRRTDGSGELVGNRLLASLGRDSRELQRSLFLLGEFTEDAVVPREEPSGTLLARLQHTLRLDDRGHPEPMTDDDRSLQVHSCHSSGRQVEVLREVLVGLLQDDPTLEPRDVLVMCPDIEAYAPLFSAVFGLLDAVGEHGHPGHQLRLRLADRGLARTNPLLELAARLIRITGGRATASEVVDLASSPPVRARFALDDEQLAEITGWARRAGVRWGLTAELRTPFGLAELPENTWHTGLDRVLLGVASAEDGTTLGGRLPLDDVGSSSVELAGALGELVDRVEATVVALGAARKVGEWVHALRRGVASLGLVEGTDAWQQAQFDREMDSLLETAAEAAGGYDGELRLADVRTLLELRLEPRPTRANFRTGHITVCTMVPMRSVPHRVVCLVGLDDGVFPRQSTVDGDDVLKRDPVTGERDPRGEDRQLLLDALLAADQTVVITYTGANINNNQPRPPAVPLDELLDTVESLSPGARESVVRRHPLQPFDPRNFSPGAGSFSFDVHAAETARSAQAPRLRPRPFLDAPLTRAEEGEVLLDELRGFLRDPVGAFLRQGLDVSTPEDPDRPQDAMPLDLDALEQWQIGDRILRRVMGAEDPERILTAELLRGDLPPRQLGEQLLQQVCARVQQLDAASVEDRTAPPTTLDVSVDLGDGRRLTGVVPDVRGDRIVRLSYSKLAPKHRLAAWVDLLALAAAFPDRPWTAVSYGWFSRYGKEGVARSLLGPVDDAALRLLRQLVDLRDRGLREPVPLYTKTSEAWATAARKGGDALGRARAAWQGSDRFPGEQADPAHVRVHGHGADLERVLGQPRDDEHWTEDEPTRLGQYAHRLWTPLVTHEKGKNL